MALVINETALIPLQAGQAVNAGWTDATDRKPMGVTWHWTATRDLALCRRVLGGASAERKGEASAHYGVGRTRSEGVDRYVALDNRSWHAGINQTMRWDGKPLGSPAFKATRTTIGIETVHVGNARRGVNAGPGWVKAATPNGKQELDIPPWPDEQIELMVEVGKEILQRWPHITVRDHHGHHDICPGYKIDPIGFPFAAVLRGIYNDQTLPDVWTPLWLPEQRQRVLIALGYGIGGRDGDDGVDGDWGRMSDAALRAFQRDQGMLSDGMWTTFSNWRVYDILRARGRDLAQTAGAALPQSS